MFLFPSIFCGIIFFIAICTDIKYQKIPNAITAPAIVAGILYHITCNASSTGFFFSLKGLLAGLGVLFIPFLMGGIGGGDVKFLGAIGSWLGISSVFSIFLYGALIGGIIALAAMIKQGGFRRIRYFFVDVFTSVFVRKRIRTEGRFRYSIPLAGGYVVYLVFGSIV